MADTLREQIAGLHKVETCVGCPYWKTCERTTPYYKGKSSRTYCKLEVDQILKLFLQELKKVKPLGGEEMTQAEIAYVKKHNLSYFPVRGKYRDDCIAQASHQNVIDQITKGC